MEATSNPTCGEAFGVFVLTIDEGKMRRTVSYSDVSVRIQRQYLLMHLVLRGWAGTMLLSFRNVMRRWFCWKSGSASAGLADCCREVAARFRVLAEVVLNQRVTTRYSEEEVLTLFVLLRVNSLGTVAEFARPALAARAGMSAGEPMMVSRQS